jgi:hypothetical protein
LAQAEFTSAEHAKSCRGPRKNVVFVGRSCIPVPWATPSSKKRIANSPSAAGRWGVHFVNFFSPQKIFVEKGGNPAKNVLSYKLTKKPPLPQIRHRRKCI